MKFNQFRFVVVAFVAFIFVSCDWLSNDTTTDPSTNPTFSSLKFGTNDSIPNLSSAAFTLAFDSLVNDSVIANLDSLPYQTRIDSVFPTFAFVSSAGAKLYFSDGSSKQLDGTDTVDFRNVVKIENIAADGVTARTYVLKVNVHQVEPELYNWSQVSTRVSTPGSNQKAVLFNNKFYYYISDGDNLSLNTSVNGYDWSSANVSGLAAAVPLSDMTVFNGKLYVTNHGSKLFTSENGLAWTETDKSTESFTFVSLLYVLNNKLWAITRLKSDQTLHFASSGDGNNWEVLQKIPENFPVSGFAALSFATRNGLPKSIVVGGLNENGTLLKNRWSTENGTYWVDFSERNHTLDTLAAGASIINYDNKLFVFGLRSDSVAPKLHFKVSIDEGLSWKKPDTLTNRLPAGFVPRAYQSMLVFKPHTYTKYDKAAVLRESNRIFIIGGSAAGTNYSDVWTGKLNRLNFLRQ